MPARKALLWSIIWIALSLIFTAYVYYFYGHQKGIEFLTGYLIEKSLSIDNLFVFLVIFTLFKVSPPHQRKILNYGIIGVIIFRGILIFLGITLIHKFSWLMYIFGGLLLYTSYHIIWGEEKQINVDKNILVRIVRKFFPVKMDYDGNKFFIRENGKITLTSLFIILLIVESTDVLFAIDSIPAIFAITTDPFIVLSSNIMAVLGLRSLYFVLVKVQDKFAYVKYGVGIVLAYIGVKMILINIYKIDSIVSLCIIITILTISVFFSQIKKKVIP